MLAAAKRALKRLPPVSAALTVGEHAVRRVVSGRHVARLPRDLPPPWDAVLQTLEADGIAYVPNYWSRERCAASRAAIDAFLDAHPDRAWVDATGADTRVYGFERVDADAAAFLADPALHAVAEATWQTRVVAAFVSAGRLEPRPHNLGSGGNSWHRDGVTQQVKAILYLDDVGPDEGPFEYVRGTVRLRDRVRHILRSGAVFRQLGWDDAGVARMAATDPGAVVTATAPAGTLVLAHTFGVHRGRPIVRGRRYSLTNYWFARAALRPVVDYYNAQVVQADGRRLEVSELAGPGA